MTTTETVSSKQTSFSAISPLDPKAQLHYFAEISMVENDPAFKVTSTSRPDYLAIKGFGTKHDLTFIFTPHFDREGDVTEWVCETDKYKLTIAND